MLYLCVHRDTEENTGSFIYGKEVLQRLRTACRKWKWNKNTSSWYRIYISILVLHHEPTYFPEPEKFDPDRFTEENKLSRPNYTYIPFGEGPRMSIGNNKSFQIERVEL